jgi:sugar lactone lactonase YvrE
MKRQLALLVFVTLAVAVLFSIAPLPAAEEAPKPGTLVTVVGTGPAGFSEDGTPALQARLNDPVGVQIDAAGTLFFVETLNHRIRKVGADGNLTTVAGSGPVGDENGEYGGDGGPAREALLHHPLFIALDGQGNLFVADRLNNRVRKVSADGIITTVAGTGKDGFSGDNLLIADSVNQRIRKVDKNGIITTIVGSGRAGYNGDGGPALSARVQNPDGLVVDMAGNLYFADLDNHAVRKVDTNGIITTVAGTGDQGYSGDGGKATEAKLNFPTDVDVDTAGNLFIADWGNYRVRKVDTNGIITTVAGSGKNLFSGEGGPATEAGLRGPAGLAIDAAGDLYFSESTAYVRDEFEEKKEAEDERILKVVGVAAPGLIAGKPFPKPNP